MADQYQHLGKLAEIRNDNAEAARRFTHALDIYERLGNQHEIGMMHGKLAILALASEDHKEARRHIPVIERVASRLGIPLPDPPASSFGQSVEELAALRRAFGPDEFNRVARRTFDEEDLSQLNHEIDDWEVALDTEAAERHSAKAQDIAERFSVPESEGLNGRADQALQEADQALQELAVLRREVGHEEFNRVLESELGREKLAQLNLEIDELEDL